MKIKGLMFVSIVLPAIFFAGCTTVNPDPSNETGIEYAEDAIGFSSASELRTKTFITPENISYAGNKIKVYDILDYPNANFEPLHYINGDKISYSNSQWVYDSGDTYLWTRTGSHTLFGWLDTDAVSNPSMTTATLFGSELSLNSLDHKTLAIPETEMTTSSPQFDFAYSNVIKRTMNNSGSDDHSAVEIQLSHLFSAISLGAQNTMKSTDITIVSATIQGLKNKRAANITFDNGTPGGTAAGIAYVPTVVDAKTYTSPLVSSVQTPVPFSASRNTKVNDIMTGSAEKKYFLMWPQSVEDLATEEFETDEDGVPTHWCDRDPLLVVEYHASTDEPGVNHTLRAPIYTALENNPMLAGKRYHISIVFAEKMIELRLSVLDWVDADVDIDYSSGTVSADAGNLLQFDSNISTVNNSTKTVTLKQEAPAVGTFRLSTPIGAEVLLSLDGDFDCFSTEIIQGGTVSSDTWTQFKVSPLIVSPSRSYSVKVNIKLRLANGSMVDADPVLQPVPFTIILPAS